MLRRGFGVAFYWGETYREIRIDDFRFGIVD
jgi:hypothetical protein